MRVLMSRRYNHSGKEGEVSVGVCVASLFSSWLLIDQLPQWYYGISERRTHAGLYSYLDGIYIPARIRWFDSNIWNGKWGLVANNWKRQFVLIVGINLPVMNACSFPVWSYLRAHNMVRSITGIGQGKGPFLSIHDGFQGLGSWWDSAHMALWTD